MLNLKIIFFALLGTFAVNANAAETQTLNLSPHLTVAWPKEMSETPLFMASTGFFIVKGKQGNHSFEAMIWRKNPTAVATDKSVKRFWDQNRKIANDEKNSKNLGCKSMRAGSFNCTNNSHYAAKGKEKAFGSADRIVWNRKSDLLYVHVKSDSDKSSQQVLDAMVVTLK